MREHRGETQPLISFSLVPQRDATHIILCWHLEHGELMRPLVSEFESGNDLERLINECAIGESEDICLAPDVWEAATEGLRNKAFNAMRHDLFRGDLEEIPRLIKI